MLEHASGPGELHLFEAVGDHRVQIELGGGHAEAAAELRLREVEQVGDEAARPLGRGRDPGRDLAARAEIDRPENVQ